MVDQGCWATFLADFRGCQRSIASYASLLFNCTMATRVVGVLGCSSSSVHASVRMVSLIDQRLIGRCRHSTQSPAQVSLVLDSLRTHRCLEHVCISQVKDCSINSWKQKGQHGKVSFCLSYHTIFPSVFQAKLGIEYAKKSIITQHIPLRSLIIRLSARTELVSYMISASFTPSADTNDASWFGNDLHLLDTRWSQNESPVLHETYRILSATSTSAETCKGLASELAEF